MTGAPASRIGPDRRAGQSRGVSASCRAPGAILALLLAGPATAQAPDRQLALTLLEDRGYRFVSLPDAVADPAYRRPDPYVGPRGLSWLQRWALDAGVSVPPEPREAPWVAEALRSDG